MKLVREHLFIGNITDANAVIKAIDLKAGHLPDCSNHVVEGIHLQVTHMLSLLSNQVLYQENPKPGDPYALITMKADTQRLNAGKVEFVPKTVPLRDMESENLLDHLEECLDFIGEGRKKGHVLVHCLAGVSRSASVITAYLMRTEKLSVDDALASLRQGSPHVCPNDGFMDQLKMFEEMGFKVDHESPIYKQFHITKLAGAGSTTSLRRPSFKNHVYNVVGQTKSFYSLSSPSGDAYGKGEKIESSRFASDPGEDSTSLVESLESQLNLHEEKKVETLYRCRKCRRLVASDSNVISHSSGVEEPRFRSKRRGGGRGHHDDDYGEPKCSSIFVEPMQWMTAVIEGLVEGKLDCVKCQARLGNFHWAGLQCSCGAWVNPAFQLHKSRMDLTWT